MSAVGQVRGVAAERVVISTSLDPFLSLEAASAWLSIKTLRRAVNNQPDGALPAMASVRPDSALGG